jgi:three-Cys-motif partner protein
MTLSDETLWDLDEHTRAKHQVLREYLDGWIAVMGSQALKLSQSSSPGVLLVDAFAGPGRYRGGEPGSSLIMLEALTSHSAFPRFAALDFHFLLIEENPARRQHLAYEVSRLSLPANVGVHVEHADFGDSLRAVVERVTNAGRSRTPTFSFLDPFGHPPASASMAERLLELPASDTIFFLPLSLIQRLVGQEEEWGSLAAVFDCESWQLAVSLAGQEQRDALVGIFQERLRRQPQVNFIMAFQLKTSDENDYRFFFATAQEKSLELMKRTMWRIDPPEGTRYLGHTESGLDVLLTADVDTSSLLAELKAEFSDRWFDMREAENLTVLHTPFIPSSHLRQKTLGPAEKQGILEVVQPEGVRRGAFVDGVLMRFV